MEAMKEVPKIIVTHLEDQGNNHLVVTLQKQRDITVKMIVIGMNVNNQSILHVMFPMTLGIIVEHILNRHLVLVLMVLPLLLHKEMLFLL